MWRGRETDMSQVELSLTANIVVWGEGSLDALLDDPGVHDLEAAWGRQDGRRRSRVRLLAERVVHEWEPLTTKAEEQGVGKQR